jgi:hypothetical protein
VGPARESLTKGRGRLGDDAAAAFAVRHMRRYPPAPKPFCLGDAPMATEARQYVRHPMTKRSAWFCRVAARLAAIRQGFMRRWLPLNICPTGWPEFPSVRLTPRSLPAIRQRAHCLARLAMARPDAKGAGRACVRCDVKFSSERKSAAALDQRLRRKAEAVERSRDWRERSSTVISLTFEPTANPVWQADRLQHRNFNKGWE